MISGDQWWFMRINDGPLLNNKLLKDAKSRCTPNVMHVTHIFFGSKWLQLAAGIMARRSQSCHIHLGSSRHVDGLWNGAQSSSWGSENRVDGYSIPVVTLIIRIFGCRLWVKMFHFRMPRHLIYIHVYMYMFIGVCMYVCIYIYLYIYICKCIYVNLYICKYVYVYICKYV